MHGSILKQNIITTKKIVCYVLLYIFPKYLIRVMRITLYTHNHMYINVRFCMALVEGVLSLLL